MVIEHNSTLLLQGDSITDAGRERPFGEGNGNLGGGYAQYIAAFLDAIYPERRIRVINNGISGNTSRDLLNRWQEDTLNLSPDWVSIMIGANDVWRQHDRPLNREPIVQEKEYKENLVTIIERTLPSTQGIVLLGPYYMGQSETDGMRVQMIEYDEIVRDLAKKYNLLYGNTQRLFDSHMKHYHPHSLSWDCIHPNHTGAMLIAKAFLTTIQFDWTKMNAE